MNQIQKVWMEKIRMVKFLFIMSLFSTTIAFSLPNPFKPGETVVAINNDVRLLTRSTTCNAKKWHNNQESSCICCLSKQSLGKNGLTNFSKSTVSHCLKKKHCTSNILNTISTAHSIPSASENEREFISSLASMIELAPFIGKLDKSYFESNETQLNEKGVLQILDILSQRGVLTPKPENLQQCFKVIDRSSSGGSQTGQLFEVQKDGSCHRSGKNFESFYFVKELKKGLSEIKNLAIIRFNSPLGIYDGVLRPVNFPALSLGVLSFKYTDPDNKPHYISVLETAQGQSIFDILKEFSISYTHYKGNLSNRTLQAKLSKARHTMQDLGRQLGLLHLKYMTRDKNGHLTGFSRAVHGDMHSNNIYRDVTNTITFIDAETFVISLKNPRDIGKDLLRIYLFSSLRNASHQNARKGNKQIINEDNTPEKVSWHVKRDFWHEQIIYPFLEAYVRAYVWPSDDQGRFQKNASINQQNLKDIMKILRKVFSFQGSTGDPEAVFLKAGVFKSLSSYRKFIIPLLDRIETTFQSTSDPKIGLQLGADYLWLGKKPR